MKIFKKSLCGLSRKLRSKEATWAKSENLVKRKKDILYQLFKTRIYAFMTYGQFQPKTSSNLKFVIRDSRVRDAQPRPRKGLEPLNLG